VAVPFASVTSVTDNESAPVSITSGVNAIDKA
jgi:hypothetical protein